MVFVARPALAQLTGPTDGSGSGASDPVASAPVHFGPLGLTPSVALTNLGVDTNVFNSVTDPQRDFTLTLVPQTKAWMHMGQGLLSGNFNVGLVYFRKFASQRGIDTADHIQLYLPFNRLQPYVSEDYVNAHQRPNYEIDARTRYMTNSTTVGLNLAMFSRTTFGVYGRQDHVSYNQNTSFFGFNLAQALDRTDTVFGAAVSHELTPFTTVVLKGEGEQDRFKYSPDRNADSTSASIGVQLNPAALISGSAFIGYRKFDALGAGVPSFRGLTASAGVSYVLLGRTQFSVNVLRDVQYSFDVTTPYYVITGVSGSVDQELFGPLSLIVDGGNQHLAYRELAGTGGIPNRVDTVQTYGGGVGYRLGHTMQISFIVNQYLRNSPLYVRQFNGLQYGVSVTYGAGAS